MPAAAVLATNTSSISIDDLAGAPRAARRDSSGCTSSTRCPPRRSSRSCVGAAHRARGRRGGARRGSRPSARRAIVVRDSPGFASSRLGLALGLEAIRMLEEGVASADDIDAAMTLGYRHPVGPLRTTDIVGLDVRLGIAEELARAPRRAIRTARPCCAAWSPRASSAARAARASTNGRTTDDRHPAQLRPGRMVDAGRRRRRPPTCATRRPASSSPGSAPTASTSAARWSTRAPSARRASARSPSTSARCCSSSSPSRSPSARTSSTRSRRAPARRRPTRGSTSTAASACCSRTRARAGASCRTRRSTSTDPSSRSRRTAHSSDGISTRGCPGVAVQINAFNFPVWGSLEKFAPAFLAGMPTLVKPATPTGYLAEAFVRILVESGLLPEGSLQLVSGSVPTLFDHLRLGDIVGFTGSASTAEKLRAHDCVQTGGVRFTSETDSINASILGADADRGHARVRRVRAPARDRDDLEGRAEVHRDPAGDRARGIRRRPRRRRARAHRRARRRRRPARRGRHDGPARLDRAARRGAAAGREARGGRRRGRDRLDRRAVR